MGKLGPNRDKLGQVGAKLGPSWAKLGQVGPKLGLSWLKLGLKWTNIAIKMHLEGRSRKYTKTIVFLLGNHSFGGVLGVKLAPTWDMLGRFEAMLSQIWPTWT